VSRSVVRPLHRQRASTHPLGLLSGVVVRLRCVFVIVAVILCVLVFVRVLVNGIVSVIVLLVSVHIGVIVFRLVRIDVIAVHGFVDSFYVCVCRARVADLPSRERKFARRNRGVPPALSY
jgi:hypothetical protein